MTTAASPAVVAPAAAVAAPAVAAPAVAAPAVAAVVAPAVAAPAVAAPAVAAVAAPAVAAPAVAAPAGAPAAYTAFTAPEGVTLAPTVVTAFEGVSRELGLPQDKAQLVIDKLAPALAQHAVTSTETARADMLAASKADTEVGGEKFDENLAVAGLAMDAYFKPEFKKFLNETGLGNHPEMIRGLLRAGAKLKPDGWVFGGKQPATDTSAQGFYNNSQMNP